MRLASAGAVLLYTLHLQDDGAFSAAFAALTASQFVEDCLAEPERLRIRFVAPRESGEALIEQIYLRGGLTWSTRAPFPSATSSPTEALQRRIHAVPS